MPNDAITHLQTKIPENWIENRIQRHNRSIINVIPDLPAYASVIGKHPHAFPNHGCLLVDIFFKF